MRSGPRGAQLKCIDSSPLGRLSARAAITICRADLSFSMMARKVGVVASGLRIANSDPALSRA
jgi:hypothetical protein